MLHFPTHNNKNIIYSNVTFERKTFSFSLHSTSTPSARDRIRTITIKWRHPVVKRPTLTLSTRVWPATCSGKRCLRHSSLWEDNSRLLRTRLLSHFVIFVFCSFVFDGNLPGSVLHCLPAVGLLYVQHFQQSTSKLTGIITIEQA